MAKRKSKGRNVKKRGAVRRSIYMVRVEFNRVERGYAERLVPRERMADDKIRAILSATVDAFLSKKCEVLDTVDIGYKAAASHIMTEVERVRDEENPAMVRGKHHEVRLNRSHIIAAKYYDTTEDGDEYEPETGDKIEPWVHLVLADGSQADVIAVQPKE